jgi:hypothetical protein
MNAEHHHESFQEQMSSATPQEGVRLGTLRG